MAETMRACFRVKNTFLEVEGTDGDHLQPIRRRSFSADCVQDTRMNRPLGLLVPSVGGISPGNLHADSAFQLFSGASPDEEAAAPSPERWASPSPPPPVRRNSGRPVQGNPQEPPLGEAGERHGSFQAASSSDPAPPAPAADAAHLPRPSVPPPMRPQRRDFQQQQTPAMVVRQGNFKKSNKAATMPDAALRGGGTGGQGMGSPAGGRSQQLGPALPPPPVAPPAVRVSEACEPPPPPPVQPMVHQPMPRNMSAAPAWLPGSGGYGGGSAAVVGQVQQMSPQVPMQQPWAGAAGTAIQGSSCGAPPPDNIAGQCSYYNCTVHFDTTRCPPELVMELAEHARYAASSATLAGMCNAGATRVAVNRAGLANCSLVLGVAAPREQRAAWWKAIGTVLDSRYAEAISIGSLSPSAWDEMCSAFGGSLPFRRCVMPR